MSEKKQFKKHLKCPDCEKKFSHSTTLFQHKSNHHQEMPPKKVRESSGGGGVACASEDEGGGGKRKFTYEDVENEANRILLRCSSLLARRKKTPSLSEAVSLSMMEANEDIRSSDLRQAFVNISAGKYAELEELNSRINSIESERATIALFINENTDSKTPSQDY